MAGAMATVQKRKEKQRKRRGGFTRRPDRTLNEEKKRRASAQKAGASREANPSDDAVMEDPDDQPLDYAIDD